MLPRLRTLVAIASGLIAVAAVVTAAWWYAHRSPVVASAGDAAPEVKLVRAREGSVAQTIATQGRIGPPAGSDAKLSFALPGIVEAVEVHVGQRVAAGEMLARIDRRGLANALAAAQADALAASATYAGGATSNAALQSASAKLQVALAHRSGLQGGGQAALSDRISAVSAARQAALKVEQDRRSVERETLLFRGGVAAQKDVEAARSQLAADLADQRSADAKVAAAGAGLAAAQRQADADVAQARSDVAAAQAARGTSVAQRDAAAAKVDSARREYDNGSLRAPSDGVVVAILKRPGEAVDPTTPVLDVAPPQNREITLSVPGDDARRVRVGNPAQLRLTGARAGARGRVVAVVPAVDPTTQATTIVVAGLPADAVAGQAVSATILVGQTSGIVVPSTAVVTDPQTGRNVVFVREPNANNPFASREVDVASNDGMSVVLRSGLRPGEAIAAQGAYDLLAPVGGG